jgi:hypothetical protein
MKRRTFFQMLGGLAAGAAAGADRPAYFNFFASPVRPDRYLRNLRDMESMRVVEEPSLRGERSLEMKLRFSEQYRNGELLWDLAPRRITRVRFSLFNPNPSSVKIRLDVRFFDREGRFWRLGDAIGKDPLKRNWSEFDFSLVEDAVITQGPETVSSDGLDGVFKRFLLNFSVARGHRIPDEPVLLYLDGIECF